MAVYQAARDDVGSTVQTRGTVLNSSAPTTIIRLRFGPGNPATPITRRSGELDRTNSAGTGTAFTPQQENSRSPATSAVAAGDMTVNPGGSGIPLLFCGDGTAQEAIGDWTPPRPNAAPSQEASAANGFRITVQVLSTVDWGITFSDDENQLHRAAASGSRCRGRRPRTSMMHYGNWNCVQGHKAAPNAYDLIRQMGKWACWRVPTQYRYKAIDGGINTTLVAPTGPASRRLLSGLGL